MQDYSNEEESAAITFVDAVEALTHIADLNLEGQLGPSNSPATPTGLEAVRILQDRGLDVNVQMVKNSFRVILKYLQTFYHKESGYLIDVRTVEQIKNIMTLVGEAAKKLDRYSQMIHGAHAESVTELKEYRQLQEFYQRRIARKIDEGVLGAWILRLTRQPQEETGTELRIKKTRAKKRVFIDLDGVKKDLEYELFFLRKEDGSRYYHPRLLRNLRLVCDFGQYFGEIKKEDPLKDVVMWRDRLFQATGQTILSGSREALDHYFRGPARLKDRELVEYLNKTVAALLLSANSHNLLSQQPVKSCTEYFYDFQQFLRAALNCREYQRLVAYPPTSSNKIDCMLLGLVHALCKGLYADAYHSHILTPVIAECIEQTTKANSSPNLLKQEPWWDRLEREYTCMVRGMRYHPNRPLESMLRILENGGISEFDPLLQHNIPSRLFDLVLDDCCITTIRMASPVRQEYIHKAIMNDEFREWLCGWNDRSRERVHLLLNLQDRTSWHEHARCRLLEEIQYKAPFDKRLTTMTLAVDTDFYHQVGPYSRINQTDLFFQQFKQHLQEDGGGFYFPERMRKELTSEFLSELFNGIHQVFFSQRNVMQSQERLNFIQLTYLFLVLKAIDIINPDSWSPACKDGVDRGSAFGALLFAALRLFNGHEEEAVDLEALQLLLYASPLLIRERVMRPDQFHRCLQAIKTIAVARTEQGAKLLASVLTEKLGHLFKRPWWKAQTVIRHSHS